MPKRKLTFLLTVAMVLLVAGILIFKQSDEVDFSTEVKPILNKNCISCHGGVKKNGGFSVLFEEEALALTKSGVAAIIPGDPKNSELIKRLHEEDPEMRMPYHRASLTDVEIKTLHKWIKQGAKWGKHWAYNPVQKPTGYWVSQQAGFSDSKKNYKGIDFFIHEKQNENQLSFSEEEDSRKLLRRVSLDITGLPPTESLQNEWLTGEITYEQLVNRLLKSPSFGEKWASWWLDLARYADTKGYERDVSRTMWKYRDWVIKALMKTNPLTNSLSSNWQEIFCQIPSRNS